MKYIYSLLRFLRGFILSLPGYKDISDFNTNWFRISIPGFLHPGNLYCFEYAVKNIKSNNPILEIGSYSGLSTNIINYYLRLNKKSNQMICCDPWVIPLEYGVNKGNRPMIIPQENLRNFVKNSFIRSIKAFSSNNLPYLVESYSDDFFKFWKMQKTSKDILGRSIKLGGKFSFCYIDGDHSYLQTKKDFVNADKYLEKEGFLFFDDTAIYGGNECADLMKEICSNKRYELIIRNPNFLFKKVK